MGMRTEHQRSFERAGHGRNIVKVSRRTRDVADRAVVAHGGVHTSADAWQRLAHSASTRTGAADVVSCWKRRSSPAAARRR